MENVDMQVNFDFVRARNMMSELDDYIKAMNELSDLLKSEVDSAAMWWKGPSYDGYKEGYDKLKGGAEYISQNLGKMRNYVNDVANKKKNIENKNYF